MKHELAPYSPDFTPYQSEDFEPLSNKRALDHLHGRSSVALGFKPSILLRRGETRTPGLILSDSIIQKIWVRLPFGQNPVKSVSVPASDRQSTDVAKDNNTFFHP
ncbi:hypothetical protein TNCV_3105541 [Trichonephila clavipes]|nr:hypothetical protein TNCV_3105541 [Trichonephila clavipes]